MRPELLRLVIAKRRGLAKRTATVQPRTRKVGDSKRKSRRQTNRRLLDGGASGSAFWCRPLGVNLIKAGRHPSFRRRRRDGGNGDHDGRASVHPVERRDGR